MGSGLITMYRLSEIHLRMDLKSVLKYVSYMHKILREGGKPDLSKQMTTPYSIVALGFTSQHNFIYPLSW